MFGTLIATSLAALAIQPVASGFDTPVLVAAPANAGSTLYVVEQGGVVQRLAAGKRSVFMDIRPAVRAGGEQGLLGLAFHPKFAQNKRFYINYTDTNGDTRVVEYRSNAGGTRALMSTRRQLLLVKQPYANHNGGNVTFGPDGRLYVGMGDGGAGGDPEDRAQNMGSLLGKLLAIKVDGKLGVRIAALGLRNPWRFSFDRKNGDLYIGDVGQGAVEEIDYLPRAQLSRLQNYGWDIFEGASKFEDTPQGPGRLVAPVAQYPHAEGCSVTGGHVYRGTRVKSAVGRYFYGDYCTATVWSLAISGGRATGVRREPFKVDGLSSFGEDAAGELYLVSHGGTIYRLAG
jgi:glucose/arabinose dehydrogenase